MALHPGEQGFCHKHGVYDEYCGECKEKKMLAKNPPLVGFVPPVDPDLDYLLEKAQINEGADYQLDLNSKQGRERRERPRMSDIKRAVEKAGCSCSPPLFGPIPQVDPDLDYLLKKAQINEGVGATTTAYDKNTPSSLKQLRWAIYEAVDNHHARSSSTELNQKIEELFKEYTNS